MTLPAFDRPWLLAALALAVLPLLRGSLRATPHAWLDMLPADPLSTALNVLLRCLLTTALALAVLAAAGMHLKAREVERLGYGSHIVLLLDRSKSMDDSFAGTTPSGNERAKAEMARQLLNDFIDHRPHDLLGVAEYSTSPLFVMPLTANRQAAHAAIDATAAPALAYTHISKGLAMALDFFADQPEAAARSILLVSDGAAVIDPDSEARLRTLFKATHVRLYWLFLRTANNPGIFTEPADSRDDNAQTMPERYLHRFFVSLGIPYQAYEAENPDAMRKAIADIDQLERLPLTYVARIPRQDLVDGCLQALAVVMLLLLALKACEVSRP